jgi:hypothetical protein
MNEWLIPLVSCLLCLGMGWGLGAMIGFFGLKKKIQAAREEKYGELKKVFDLTNNRAKVTTYELGVFVDFVNDQLPKEITNICIAEPKLLILKERAGIPDKAYLEAIEPIIINTQYVISERLTIAIENITAETIKDIKGLMTDVPKT